MDVTPAGIDAAYQLYKYFSAFVADRRTGADAGADDLADRAASRPRATASSSPTTRSSGSCSC